MFSARQGGCHVVVSEELVNSCHTTAFFNSQYSHYCSAKARASLGMHAKALATGCDSLRISCKLAITSHSAASLPIAPIRLFPSSSSPLVILLANANANAVASTWPTMPPRLPTSNFSAQAAPQISSCSAVRPQTVSLPVRTSRHFSQTPCPQVTLRRRKFYEWLNGPGRQLKEPIPGSTNYLGAYDKYGNLVRAGPGWRKDGAAKAATGAKTDKPDVESQAEKPAEEKTPEAQENLDELEAAIRSSDAESKEMSKTGEEADDGKLPPETAEDLRPFPLNQYFRSQPVLSEDLREAIYNRVKKEGATVSLASVEFGVSNERVGAVVRLKQMEKEWIAQVCPFFVLTFPHDMMSFLKNRLVFKTPTWLQNLSHALAERRRHTHFPIYNTVDDTC
jgi:hypothetical protein